jgi:ankyrin repeat protein
MTGDQLVGCIETNGRFPVRQLSLYLDHADVDRTFGGRHAYEATNKTLLLYAAHHGDTDAIRLLVARGANVNHQDSHGWTALHFALDEEFVGATQDGHHPADLPITRLLLKMGCDPTIANNDGQLPWQLFANCWTGMQELYDSVVSSTKTKA